jgi:hypothetical protein
MVNVGFDDRCLKLHAVDIAFDIGNDERQSVRQEIPGSDIHSFNKYIKTYA